MRIECLAHHQHFIPTVARWYFDAWGKYSENSSIESAKARLANRLNTDKLNICFLCFNDCANELIGTFSLTQKDIPNNEDFSPCLSHLFVIEKYRRQKIGEALVNYAKQQARKCGFEKMYLYTTDKTVHLWYEKLSWKIIKEDVIGKFDIKIMETNL
ncbi:MAG: GNAT family N-acetyltransferase [Holosporaceae bacterium]|jgi:GNAT superfamily N-acetyltransferase|nr:GNAT family N-acetyltransferase [Holosporaceae bacterium]